MGHKSLAHTEASPGYLEDIIRKFKYECPKCHRSIPSFVRRDLVYVCPLCKNTFHTLPQPRNQ